MRQPLLLGFPWSFLAAEMCLRPDLLCLGRKRGHEVQEPFPAPIFPPNPFKSAASSNHFQTTPLKAEARCKLQDYVGLLRLSLFHKDQLAFPLHGRVYFPARDFPSHALSVAPGWEQEEQLLLRASTSQESLPLGSPV